MGHALTFFLRGQLERSRSLLKGIGSIKEAGKRVEQRLGDYLTFWRSSDRRNVVKKQRNRRGQIKR
jgi:hypothetical protein